MAKVLAATLNESPSEKEGKFLGIDNTEFFVEFTLNESPYEKVGKCLCPFQTAPPIGSPSMKVPTKK